MQSVDLRPTQFEIVAPTPSSAVLWTFMISGNLPTTPLGGLANAYSCRQPAHFFPRPVARFRVSASGEIAWSRIYVKRWRPTCRPGPRCRYRAPRRGGSAPPRAGGPRVADPAPLTLRVTVTRSRVSTTRMSLVCICPGHPNGRQDAHRQGSDARSAGHRRLCAAKTRSNPGDRWLRTPGPPHRSVPLRCIAFNAEWKEARA